MNNLLVAGKELFECYPWLITVAQDLKIVYLTTFDILGIVAAPCSLADQWPGYIHVLLHPCYRIRMYILSGLFT